MVNELSYSGEWRSCGEYEIARVVGLADYTCIGCGRRFVKGEIVVRSVDFYCDSYWCQECKKDIVLAYVW